MDSDHAPQAIDDSRSWLLLLGTLMLTFGVLAAIAPSVTGVVAELAAGWLLLLGGLFGLGLTVLGPPFGTQPWWWNLGASTFAALIGALLLFQPLFGVLSLTLLLAGFLAASGLAKLAIAILYRASIGSLAAWIAAAGVLDIAIAWIVLWQWPLSSAWFLSLMVGANLIANGVLLLSAAEQNSAPAADNPRATAP